MFNFADLHCDTLTEIYTNNLKLEENELHISLNRATNFNKYCQVFAIWTNDKLAEEQRFENFINVYNYFINNKPENLNICKNYNDVINSLENNKISAILAVEDAGVLNGNIGRIDYLHDIGVRFITLTWNSSNELSDGIKVDNAGGLTHFGKLAVAKMQEKNIIVDVSHISEKGFWDVCEISKKPFVATHSNSKTICEHFRNLNDEQFKAIVENKGLVGINLCGGFLNNIEDDASIDDIIRHIDYFLSLGGEDTLCFGADFDGIDTLPKGIKGINDIYKIYEEMLKRNYSQKTTDRIFFNNFIDFIANNLI